MDLRAQLEDLARRLHLVQDERAETLREDVRASLEGSASLDEHDHSDLSQRLSESAVHFEAAHPELAGALRRIADALAASGI